MADELDTEEDSEIACEPAESYPAWAEEEEQRRAFVLECISPLACELAAGPFIEYWFDIVRALETGEAPVKVKRVKIVS
jgi:hypothetical protein